MTERELLIALKTARQQLTDVKLALKDCQAVYDKAESELIDHLTSIQADGTSRYDGIGYALMVKPRIYASCLVENKERLKYYLKSKGREDLIKEDIPAPSLSAYVGELVESGNTIPEFINYYLKTSLKIY